MSSHPLDRRHTRATTVAAALFLAAGVWLASDLAAQDPEKKPAPPKNQRIEEEEDPKAAPAKPADKSKAMPGKGKREEEEDGPSAAKKIPRVEDDDTPAKPLPGRASSGAFDLAARAKQTKNPILRDLYARVKRPHDEFSYKTRPNPEPVLPVPYFVGKDASIHWPAGGMAVRDLDADGNAGKPHNPPQSTVRAVLHYEQLVIEAVDEFLDKQAHAPDRYRLPREEQLAAADAVLSSALRFHESAVSRGERKGEEWEEAVVKPLKARLLGVEIEQLQALADAGDWDGAFGLTVVLAREYTSPKEQERIAKPLIDLLSASFRSGIEKAEGTGLALRRLRDLEYQFNDKSSLQPISKGLHEFAESLHQRAVELEAANQPEQALKLMGQAVELWPERDELKTYQLQLMQQHAILRVGVRTLPEFMSPGRATADSEVRAVELMFESLVKFGVDSRGNARFVPGMAEGRPKVEPLGRTFQLPRQAYWSDNKPLTGYDVRFTVKRLVDKKGEGGQLNPAWGQLLRYADVSTSAYRVSLPMAQGYLEPPSLMAFKVLPSYPRDDRDESFVDSADFAKNPVGSGPFRYDDKGIKSEAGRSCVNFIFNPLYGRRPGKEGLPRIQEVRFFTYTPYDGKGNPAEEFDRPQTSAPLQVLLDLTPAHAAALKKAGRAATHARVLIPGDGETPTRRVYFLAVNHSRTVLDKPAVRRAIAHAINREKLLDDFFREKVPAGTGPVLGRRLHAALNGPYPAGSWACDPSVGVPKINGSLDLFDPMQSQSLKKQALDTEIERTIKLQLKYPDDDPAVKDAMDALCKQLQETLGFTVNATGRTPHDLRNDVESGDYQLAYYSYEFPDDTYPLWPLMAPVKGGENIFHSPPGDVEQRFQAAKAYRDFARVKKDTWQIHAALYEAMPFIPLWQLDPLAAVHDSVEAPWFDPLLVFTEIERWKVSPR